MSTISGPPPTEWTIADLFEAFGPIPFNRLRQHPAPGTGTEQDVTAIHDQENRLYELVDGVLVEKAMGIQESYLAVLLGRLLSEFVDRHNLGFVLGTDGMARLALGLVRIPGVWFISWKQVPERRIPRVAMLRFAPDLAVEVLSPTNTRQEMERKLHDYFTAGTSLVWYVDPKNRMVQVFTGVDQSTLLDQSQILTGEPVLPGFVLPLAELFARLAE
jgi:Uma2 family endonuclease